MLNRRQIIAGSLASLSAPSFSSAVLAKDDAIDVGVITSLSGTFGSIGEENIKGVQLLFEKMPPLFGKRLKPVMLDDQGDVGRAVRLTQEAMQQRGIRYFVNCTTSANALAVSKEVARGGGVYINQAGADEMTGSECNRNTFRWPVASYSAVNATIRPFAARFPEAKKWYTITGQYVFGESLLKNTKDTLKELGFEHVGNSYHSLSDREYSGYITAAIAAQPDVLAICNFGSQTIDVLRQAVSFGLKRNTKILVVWSTGLDQYQAWGPETCDGVYFGANYWHSVDSPGNRLITAAVAEKFKTVPNYLVVSGWAVAQILYEGLKKAGSEDPTAVIEALEHLSYDGATGTEVIRPEDHQVIKDYYLTVGKPKARMVDDNDYVDILAGNKMFIAPDKTGCKFK